MCLMSVSRNWSITTKCEWWLYLADEEEEENNPMVYPRRYDLLTFQFEFILYKVACEMWIRKICTSSGKLGFISRKWRDTSRIALLRESHVPPRHDLWSILERRISLTKDRLEERGPRLSDYWLANLSFNFERNWMSSHFASLVSYEYLLCFISRCIAHISFDTSFTRLHVPLLC